MAERSYRAPKGTKDILPGEVERWQFVEATARELFAQYRYAEARTPAFEGLELFVRGVGEHTDIVSKEMYVFSRKGEGAKEQLFALRPEGTAGVARAYIEHKLFTAPAPQKFWYFGPMFRYERPQAGRQRQFHQLGVECLGSDDPRRDAEVIVLAIDLLARLGLSGLEVQLNSVGCSACRPVYREKLQAHLHAHQEALCEDCVVRTEKNPLRVLDCKVPGCQPVIAAAPELAASLCDRCQGQLDAVRRYLEAGDVSYRLNPRLVRGLDYYTGMVFEIVAEGLGAQNTVCAGGRYDQLIEDVGGPATPAVGWGLGVERVLMLMPEGLVPEARLDAVVIARGDEALTAGFKLAHRLRRSGYTVDLAPDSKMDKQFKYAERMRARYALVLGESELADGTVTVKDLDRHAQSTMPASELEGHMERQKTEELA